jgi:tetratricopeptide (TPR) repeat protein
VSAAFEAIEWPDLHHVRAASGWLELGTPGEARRELARVNPALLHHPEILQVRWAIAAADWAWGEAEALARRLVQEAPDCPDGYLHLAYALRRLEGHGISEAEQVLAAAAGRFPEQPLIPYNLACYAAQQGRLEEAWELLHRAMEAEGHLHDGAGGRGPGGPLAQAPRHLTKPFPFPVPRHQKSIVIPAPRLHTRLPQHG